MKDYITLWFKKINRKSLCFVKYKMCNSFNNKKQKLMNNSFYVDLPTGEMEWSDNL